MPDRRVGATIAQSLEVSTQPTRLPIVVCLHDVKFHLCHRVLNRVVGVE